VIPLRVTAYISQQVVARSTIALDSLLMAMVARRDGLPPLEVARRAGEVHPIEIPIALSPCGRIYLCSHAKPEWEEYEHRWRIRRPAFGALLKQTKLGTLNDAAGPNKADRVPYQSAFVKGGRIDWWCLGDRAQVAALLELCTSIGGRRSTGLGRVDRWEVEPCEAWPGFTVTREGVPLRTLPTDWTEATEYVIDEGLLMPPYSDDECWRSEYVLRAL
jgi:hypothetical protein